MRAKISAIWRLLFSEHYLVVTTHSFFGCYPKETKNINFIKEMCLAAEKALIESKKEGGDS